MKRIAMLGGGSGNRDITMALCRSGHDVTRIVPASAQIVAMLKPQFEAGRGQTNKGVIKNNAVRRRILADFELWAERYFVIADKRDSEVAGQKGNVERFYLLRLKKS